MATLYKIDTYDPVEVEDNPEVIRQALASGKYMYRTVDGQVSMRGPEGLVAVPGDAVSVNKALRSGLLFESRESERKRALEAEYSPVEAAAVGALSGVTLGTGPMILSGLGVYAKDELREMEEARPGAMMAGEISGAIASSIFTGGLGALAPTATATKAALAAGKVVSGVTKLGKAGKLVGVAATAATDAALYGLGKELSNSYVHDKDFAAESVLADAGIGALLGPAAVLAPKVLGAIASPITKPAKYLTGKGKGILGNTYAKWSARLTGKSEQDIAKLIKDKNYRAIAMEAEDVLQKGSPKLAEDLSFIEKTDDLVIRAQAGKLKEGHLDRLITTGDQGKIVLETQELLKSSNNKVTELLELAGQAPGSTEARTLKKILAQKTKEIGGQIAEGASTSKLYRTIDLLKKDLGNVAYSIKRTDSSVGSIVRNKADEIASEYRNFLERADLFGDAAIAQSNINRAYAKYLETSRYKPAFPMLKLRRARKGVPIFEADQGKTLKFVKKLGTDEAKMDVDVLVERLNNRMKVMDEMENMYRLDQKTVGKFNQVREKTATVMESLTGLESANAARRSWKSIQGDRGGGLFAGGLYLGGAGAPVAGLVYGLLNPGKVIGVMSALDKYGISATYNKVASKIRKASAKSTGKPKGKFIPISRAAFNQKQEKELKKDMVKGAQDIKQSIDRLQDNRGYLQKQAAQLKDEEMSSSLLNAADRAVAYLQAKAPKAQTQSFLDQMAGKDPGWSKQETYEWLQRVAVVKDPLVILEMVKEDQLSKAAVDTMKAVYPKMYEKVLTSIEAQVMKNPEEIDYNKRVQLSLLFGQPFDRTMEKSFIELMTQTDQLAQGSPEAGSGMSPKGGGGSGIKTGVIAKNLASPADKVSNVYGG